MAGVDSSRALLSLDRTDHDTLLKIFLDKRIDHQNRQRGYDNDAVLDLVGISLRVSSRVSSGARPTGKHLIRQQDVPQNNLQRLQVIIANIDQRRKEVIPMPDQIIEADHGDHRFRKRQRHLEEKGEVRAAVHDRRLVQFLRQRALEERPGDN